jgi:hypothetical protein
MFIGFAFAFEFNADMTLNEVMIMVISAAFFEELFFRGVLFGQIYRYTKFGFISAEQGANKELFCKNQGTMLHRRRMPASAGALAVVRQGFAGLLKASPQPPASTSTSSQHLHRPTRRPGVPHRRTQRPALDGAKPELRRGGGVLVLRRHAREREEIRPALHLGGGEEGLPAGVTPADG